MSSTERSWVLCFQDTMRGGVRRSKINSLFRRALSVVDLALALAIASVPALLTFAEASHSGAMGISSMQHRENFPAAVRTFGDVLAFACVPSVVFGTLYDLACSAQSVTLAVIGRITASVSIVALGIFAFFVGFISAESYYPPDPKFPPPPPFGAHVGALAGTGAVLALSGALALLLIRGQKVGHALVEEQRQVDQ